MSLDELVGLLLRTRGNGDDLVLDVRYVSTGRRSRENDEHDPKCELSGESRDCRTHSEGGRRRSWEKRREEAMSLVRFPLGFQAHLDHTFDDAARGDEAPSKSEDHDCCSRERRRGARELGDGGWKQGGREEREMTRASSKWISFTTLFKRKLAVERKDGTGYKNI